MARSFEWIKKPIVQNKTDDYQKMLMLNALAKNMRTSNDYLKTYSYSKILCIHFQKKEMLHSILLTIDSLSEKKFSNLLVHIDPRSIYF